MLKGQILIIENCVQFRTTDGQTEQIVVLNDFRAKFGSDSKRFNWTGKWSKHDKRWTKELKEAL